ncbi:MAG: hypothetical protein NC182_07925, partial [Prevotella sp.]|nr:hypothetical protein [Staphylococcus sp.]MCM1351102.1 hypothetical protein [Prevotella sp.]
ISLISIGFSSWILPIETKEVYGYMTADNSIDLSSIIVLDTRTNKLGISTFKLGNDGFISDGQFKNSADIIFNFKIDYSKFNNVKLDNNTLTLRLELKQNPINDFILINSKYMLTTMYLDINDQGLYSDNYSIVIDEDNCSCYVDFSLSDEKIGTSMFYFSIKFSFNISDLETYKTELALYSNDTETKFKLKIASR